MHTIEPACVTVKKANVYSVKFIKQIVFRILNIIDKKVIIFLVDDFILGKSDTHCTRPIALMRRFTPYVFQKLTIELSQMYTT